MKIGTSLKIASSSITPVARLLFSHPIIYHWGILSPLIPSEDPSYSRREIENVFPMYLIVRFDRDLWSPFDFLRELDFEVIEECNTLNPVVESVDLTLETWNYSNRSLVDGNFCVIWVSAHHRPTRSPNKLWTLAPVSYALEKLFFLFGGGSYSQFRCVSRSLVLSRFSDRLESMRNWESLSRNYESLRIRYKETFIMRKAAKSRTECRLALSQFPPLSRISGRRDSAVNWES